MGTAWNVEAMKPNYNGQQMLISTLIFLSILFSSTNLHRNGAMLAQCWRNTGAMLTQCWRNAGAMLKFIANIEPALGVILTWHGRRCFRPLLCAYNRLNWAMRTSWGWWDEWNDTALQTQYSKLELSRSEAEHATSQSQRLSTILSVHEWMGKKHFCFFQTAETGKRTPNSRVKGSGAIHYPRAPAQAMIQWCRYF